MKLAVNAIEIGSRHRRSLGDLETLARSIRKLGLLQPIGVLPDKHCRLKHRLIFGQRRLTACRNLLGWKEIEARIIDIESIASGEFAENEVRKDFTPSERAAVVETLRSRNCAGRPENSENFPNKISTKEAAALAGFGNERTFRDAKKVVEQGSPDLRGAMDAGVISISAAAVMTKLPPKRQSEVIQARPARRREVVRSLRAGAGDPQQPAAAGASTEKVDAAAETITQTLHLLRAAGLTPKILNAAPPRSRTRMLDAGRRLTAWLTPLLQPQSGAASAAWDAYAQAYRRRYAADPVRNARVNAQLSRLAARLPAADAPAVAAWYVDHPNASYAGRGHPVGLLLANAETLHMEWRTGRRLTPAKTRQDERSAANVQSSLGALEILENLDAQS